MSLLLGTARAKGRKRFSFMRVIANAFKFGGKSQLVASTSALESFRTELASKEVARFEIPGKK